MRLMDLFSAGYKEIKREIPNKVLIEAFEELRRSVDSNLRVLSWPGPGRYVLAALTVNVDLPSRGPVRGIDIRKREPILLFFDAERYPNQAPQARSDRKDFPVESLPHLNAVPEGEPASMCLYRGNMDDWYSWHSLVQFVERVRGWLRDAARNRLIPPGDGFEATRLDYIAKGACVLDNTQLVSLLRAKWKERKGSAGHIFLQAQRLTAEGADFPFFMMRINANQKSNVQGLDYGRHQISSDSPLTLLVMGPRDLPCSRYFGKLPANLGGLCTLSGLIHAPITEALTDLTNKIDAKIIPARSILVLLAIPRPRPLLGSESSIEILCFLINGELQVSEIIGEKSQEISIQALQQFCPLLPEKAINISAAKPYYIDSHVAVLGCGALGSKLALHLARAGWTRLLLVDGDFLSSHNLVRHGLLASRVGCNKAEALTEEIKSLYPTSESRNNALAFGRSAFDLMIPDKIEVLQNAGMIIDCTASSAMGETLATANLADRPAVLCCGIADSGRLGILSMEGSSRNPRLDDLRMFLYDQANENEIISDWLRGYREKNKSHSMVTMEEIEVGLGCSSDTMRLADDVISVYAAVFARTAREQLSRSTIHPEGLLRLIYQPDEGINALKSWDIRPGKIDDITALNDSSWHVRISSALLQEIKKKASKSVPTETGGVLLGAFHPKKKILYVTRQLDPPPDSAFRPHGFTRGKVGLSKEVLNIQEKTGGMISYVGEWHSHLNGSGLLSETDMEAVKQLRRYLDPAGIPTHILVLSKGRPYCHVFDNNSDI